MKKQQHIIFKIAAIVLLLAVLLPSAVKFDHVFEDHKHEVCTDDHSTTHAHEIDLECEFYKFKLNTYYYTFLDSYSIVIEDNYSKINNTFYNFQYNYQQLSFSLRGPPTF